MIEYLKMGLAIWLGKLVLVLLLASIVLFVALLLGLRTWFKQRRCQHQTKFENGQCHFVCYSCRKDLGFVGSYKRGNR